MIVGSVVATGLFCFLVQWDRLDYELSMLVLMALFFGLMMLGLSFLAPAILGSSSVKELAGRYAESEDLTDNSSLVDKLFGVFQTNLVIRFALIEAVLLLNLLVFMLEKNPLNLVVVGLGLLMMLGFFPFSSRVTSWIGGHIRGMTN